MGNNNPPGYTHTGNPHSGTNRGLVVRNIHTGKKRMGRPSKFTPERVEVIIKALEIGNYVQQAVASADVDRGTFDLWLNKGRTFSDEYPDLDDDAAMLQCMIDHPYEFDSYGSPSDFLLFYRRTSRALTISEHFALSTIDTAIKNGDAKTALQYLMMRQPERYNPNRIGREVVTELSAESMNKIAEIVMDVVRTYIPEELWNEVLGILGEKLEGAAA